VELGIAKGVADYLKSINEKNHQINQGKTQFLLDAFERVRERYDYYSKLISDLRRFFKGDDTQITGGYRVSLGFSASKDYPIEWIGDLRRSLNEWKIGQTELFKNGSDSLDDVIFETFRKRVGYSRERPDIRMLLDPKSYFDLSFELESARGTTHGSTGQAYTAIALLCIARLSVIEEKQKKGVRFMPIDEAEGIGSNYETLYNLALKYDYQVVSMSIRNVEGIQDGRQNIYMLNANLDSEAGINHPPSPFLEYGGEQMTKWKEATGE
jgi:DNA repair protein SbcC/Rad50